MLIDFGIANRIGEVPDTEAGTTAYMAPERFRAGQPVSVEMDTWALGIIFYQMLTGRHPFEQDGKLPRDDDNLAWARLLENHQPVPPSQVTSFSDLPQVNRAIDGLVLRMLSKKPGDRAAMDSVSSQLQDITHLVRVTKPEPPSGGILSWIQEHSVRLAASIVGLLLLALIVLGINAFMRAVPPPPATPVPIAEGEPAAESGATGDSGSNPLPPATPSPSPTPTPAATLPPITPGAAFDFGDGRTGVFIQGNQDPAAGPLRDPFIMMDSEVTNAQYQACIDAGRCTAPIAADAITLGSGEEYDAHPVTGIDAQQAVSYTIWAGGALPTDAEWFLACTGGDENRVYPWGGQPIPQGSDEMPANYKGDGTMPVGQFPVDGTPFGLHDIVGNAWEWTTYADGYRLRGGSWGGKTTDARCTALVDAGAGKLAESSLMTGSEAVDANEIGFRMVWPYDPSRVLVQATPTPAPTVTPEVYAPILTPDPCPAGAKCVKIPPPPNGIRWLDPICVRIPADRSSDSFVITKWPDLKDPNQEIKRVNVFLYLPENRVLDKPTAAADGSQDRDNVRQLSIRATGGTEFNVQLKNETDYEQTAEIRFDGLDLVDCKP